MQKTFLVLHFTLVPIFMLFTLLIVFLLYEKMKSWSGLNLMMFHSLIAGIGYYVCLLLMVIFPTSRLPFQAGIIFGFYCYYLSVALSSLHMYTTLSFRIVNVPQLFLHFLHGFGLVRVLSLLRLVRV